MVVHFNGIFFAFISKQVVWLSHHKWKMFYFDIQIMIMLSSFSFHDMEGRGFFFFSSLISRHSLVMIIGCYDCLLRCPVESYRGMMSRGYQPGMIAWVLG